MLLLVRFGHGFSELFEACGSFADLGPFALGQNQVHSWPSPAFCTWALESAAVSSTGHLGSGPGQGWTGEGREEQRNRASSKAAAGRKAAGRAVAR